MKSHLEDVTSKLESTTSELSHLRLSFEGEKSNNSSLHLELARLRENLESEKTSSATLRVCLEKERDEKDSALLRIARISQEMQLVKQESGRQEVENLELQNRVEKLVEILKSKEKDVEESFRIQEETTLRLKELEETERTRERLEGNEKVLKNTLSDMEEQLQEKTKVRFSLFSNQEFNFKCFNF